MTVVYMCCFHNECWVYEQSYWSWKGNVSSVSPSFDEGLTLETSHSNLLGWSPRYQFAAFVTTKWPGHLQTSHVFRLPPKGNFLQFNIPSLGNRWVPTSKYVTINSFQVVQSPDTSIGLFSFTYNVIRLVFVCPHSTQTLKTQVGKQGWIKMQNRKVTPWNGFINRVTGVEKVTFRAKG